MASAENMEKAVRNALDPASPPTCPSCGETRRVYLTGYEAEPYESYALGELEVYGSGTCSSCGASWSFRVAMRAVSASFELD